MASILIDFDGTCVSHEFPKVGKEIGAAPVLKKLVERGHKLILFTMRCDFDGTEDLNGSPTGCNEPEKYLTEAVNWFKKHNIPLYGIQTNPTQSTWTTSHKAYGDFMIDDSAIGTPLTLNMDISLRAFVNWDVMEKLLKAHALL